VPAAGRHDFFLGTGVGTKAYAIIEQGRIGRCQLAPAGSRAIIEEGGHHEVQGQEEGAEKKLDRRGRT